MIKNSKHQKPNTREVPNTKFQSDRARRCLSFGAWCLLGVWCLVFGVSPAFAQKLFVERPDSAAAEVDKMYVRGLQSLARSQTAQGNWSDSAYGAEPAVVSLATLAFLAHGDDPNRGPYAKPIRAGLKFLLDRQDAKTGYIGNSMYNHGFATLGLAEAYGMVDDERLGPALEKAVALILQAQKKNTLGGWRYSPESTDADTTVSGAQMVALFAARNAGIAVPEDAIQKALDFFLAHRAPNGGFGYASAADPNAARTAIGCTILALAKEKDLKAFQDAVAFLKTAPMDPSHPQYYLYYASQAFFHASSAEWQGWNRKNIKALGVAQNADGSWSGQYGATFGTATSLLSLALNYRYLPIYER